MWHSVALCETALLIRHAALYHRRMPVSQATLRAASVIGLEATLAEVAAAMHERGVRPLPIKAPAVAAWLYDDPSERPYGS